MPVHNALAPAPEFGDEAVELVTQRWAQLAGWVDIGRARPTVVWFFGECLEYDDAGETCFEGRYWDGDLHVLWAQRAARTSLAHEVLHWTLHQWSGDPNPDHDHPLWKYVRFVNEELELAGY